MKKISIIFLLGLICSFYAFEVSAQKCKSSTTEIWAETRNVSSIDIRYAETKIFRTNAVCNATSYTWTVGGQASLVTNVPYVSLKGRDLVWYPPGGCLDFNEDWTPYNPITDPEIGNGNGPGEPIPYGYYETTLTVQANIGGTFTIPVTIQDVAKCSEWGGLPTPGD